MNTRLETARRHRVAIVGCGFGGLFAAKRLRRADVDITVIDRTNHHLFQPLLYQVATGILSARRSGTRASSPQRVITRQQVFARHALEESEGIGGRS